MLVSHEHRRPGLGTQVRWRNPLTRGMTACWPLLEGNSAPFDLVKRRRGDFQNATATSWSQQREGISLLVNQVNTARILLEDDAGSLLPDGGGFTALAVFERVNENVATQSLFGVNTSTNPERCGCWFPFSDGVIYWDFGGNVEGTTRLSVAAPSFKVGRRYVALVTTGPQGMKIWLDGVRLAANSANPARTNTFTLDFYLGHHFTVSGAELYYSLFALWNREMPDSEARALTLFPYQVLEPTTPPYFTRAANVTERAFDLPVETLQTVEFDRDLIYEVLGQPADRDLAIETLTEVQQAFALAVDTSIAFDREFRLPVDIDGVPQLFLLHDWTVRQLLNSPLPHLWNVVRDDIRPTLPHTWNVLRDPSVLGHTWRVLPDIVGVFDDDIQRPVGTVERTP